MSKPLVHASKQVRPTPWQRLVGWWVPDRVVQKELIDSYNQPASDFLESFRDIEKVNRYLGGTSLVIRRFAELLGSRTEPSDVLDVCTGSADIPRAVTRWGAERTLSFQFVGLDANDKVLYIAAEESAGTPNMRLVEGDALNLPFADDSFDYVFCSLSLHHFDDPDAVLLMQEMMRVSRLGILVNDLRRGYLPAALIWLVTRVLGMNRLTRHDAPLSVMRSRTMSEYRDLVSQTGLGAAKVYKHAFWRAAIVARKNP
jgi:ubiquinone/menaquinone biosynthesis C-methylase UbiE